MLSSITPVGESARGQRWTVTVIAHAVGAALGGAVLGSAVGVLGGLSTLAAGPLPPSVVLAVLSAVAAGAAVIERGPLAVSVPTWHRQVDERWLDSYRGWVYGAGFGAQLGFGVVTIVPTWATPAMLVAMGLSASPVNGALIGVTYGLMRALPVLGTFRLTEPDRLWRFHERLEGATEKASWATAAGLVTIAATGAVMLGTGT